MIGTVLLRASEAEASATHWTALTDSKFTGTALTHAFSGSPVRVLRNAFTAQHTAPHSEIPPCIA